MKVIHPQMGHYNEVFKFLIEGLGFEYFAIPQTNQEQIKLGVRHSSSMVCFPFKATLGNLIKGLDMGADTIIATDVHPSERVKETCRFGFYYPIMEKILVRLDYKFDMLYIPWKPYSMLRILKKMSKASGKNLSYFKIIKLIYNSWKLLKQIEYKYYRYEPKKVNIGIVGEAYTIWEESVNYNIIKKLKEMDVGVHVDLKLSDNIKMALKIPNGKKYLEKEIKKKYFPKHIGGHGFESLVSTLYYAKNNFDGVIHLLPLSCMPESMVEMSMNMIGEDYKMPIYRFPIDENFFEAGFQTRLETFIKLLKRNKK
jgi:predicted nucleotide-binding protein (sugar kinase/HSP70/actin superfamily)